MNTNIQILTETLTEARASFIKHYVEQAFIQWTEKKAEDVAKFTARNQTLLAQCASDRRWHPRVAEESAALEFGAYVAKLASKIEAKIQSVVSLTGGLWNGSVLTVDTDAGRQSWDTSCKHNYRYGRNSRNGHCTHYYQFPTKRIA